MKTMLFAAASALALTFSAPAAAATLADFRIVTEIEGNNVPGTPTTATLTGVIDYDAFFASSAGGSSALTDFNVLLGNGSNYNAGNFTPFSSGVNAVLNLTTGQTGFLDIIANGSSTPLFSFALSGLFTADGQGALPGGGLTLTQATTIENVSIAAGSTGSLSVTAAVPEPSTWAMMLVGFGAIGATMRRRRSVKAVPQMA